MGGRALPRARRGQARGGGKKLVERAEAEWGEAGELAAAHAATERNLRKRAAREGREYVPQPGTEIPAPPDLLPENVAAWELFSACSSQLILGGFGGVVGVDHTTLVDKMNVREIPAGERYELERKFRLLEVLFVKQCNAGLSSKKEDRG